MNVNVLMASGEEDRWENVEDAIDDRGSLVVVNYIDGDEVSSNVKTLTVSRETEDPPTKFVEVFQVVAVYAPGMWMRAEFS